MITNLDILDLAADQSITQPTTAATRPISIQTITKLALVMLADDRPKDRERLAAVVDELRMMSCVQIDDEHAAAIVNRLAWSFGL